MTFGKVSRKILARTLGSAMSYRLLKQVFHKRMFPYVQAVTYHGTPESLKNCFREHLKWYRDNFRDCDLSALRLLLEQGVWPHDKPGLIVSFDDGLRSNYDIALPLIEEFGFTGWFMIPPGFVNTEAGDQREFARHKLIDVDAESAGDRVAMTWREITDIQRRGHVVASHTMYHTRLSNDLSGPELEVEICGAKTVMEARLSGRVDVFSWVGGEEWAYSGAASGMIADAGHSMVFATNCAPITRGQSALWLERYHVDADYALNDLRLVLGGLYDLKYFRKRQRVAGAIRADAAGKRGWQPSGLCP
jgi:peptidoglycan/xylan/chitin deacetylase (PgdA/CDA1 family)